MSRLNHQQILYLNHQHNYQSKVCFIKTFTKRPNLENCLLTFFFIELTIPQSSFITIQMKRYLLCMVFWLSTDLSKDNYFQVWFYVNVCFELWY